MVSDFARYLQNEAVEVPWDRSISKDMGVSMAMGVSPNGWFVVENPIKVDDDWGYPHFRNPPYVIEKKVAVRFLLLV